MNRIRLLSEQVANQIAAGEVVERPASVVKELVENSLDAGATSVTVEIQLGGRSLIRVTDDGAGMSRDDALLCLERHATSKIRRAEDLSAIATLGFRGEALPSIASVSRFLLQTREREGAAVEGTEILVQGGKIAHARAAGHPVGTSIEVRQLFYNLPARRKFLRSEETEAAHIQHYLTLAALSHPQVAMTYIKDGRPAWQLPALSGAGGPARKFEALQERLRALLGDVKLIPLEFESLLPEEDPGESPEAERFFRVWGFIGAPGVSRSTREDQHVFVNRRPVENRGINFALLEGYHNALMKGRYPVCCLFVELDPAGVDVNIHPAKREVKFHRERAVRALMGEAVRGALLKFHAPAAPAALREVPPAPAVPVPEFKWAAPPAAEERPESARLPGWPARPAAVVPLPPAPAATLSVPSEPVPLLHVPLRLIGVVGRLYLVLESDRGLVLLDQHAAHERVLYEQMLRRLEESGQAASQRLLLPETIELSPRDAGFLREQLPALGRLGVGLNEFGAQAFILDGLPPFVKMSDPRRFVIELLDELRSAGSGVNALRLGEQVVARTVCRHAVKANDPLQGAELENLVNDLRQCSMPYTCPHGRPTIIEMNFRELEKKFGRIQ